MLPDLSRMVKGSDPVFYRYIDVVQPVNVIEYECL